MQSFVVVLAVCFGVAFAYHPMKIEKHNEFDDFQNESQKKPFDDKKISYTTSSDFLKHVFNDHHNTRLNIAEPSPSDGVADLYRLIDFSSLIYPLTEAKRIFDSIDLRQLLTDQQLTTLSIFVPDDDAVREWKEKIRQEDLSNVDLMKELVKAWVVPRVTDNEKWRNDDKLPTLRKDVKLRVNDYAQTTVNGARIYDASGTASCTMYITRDVIYPLPDGPITEELKRAGHFKTFLKLLGKDGQAKIDGYDALTVFAPTDEAFDKLDKSDVDLLIKAGNWQEYVVPKTMYTAGFEDIPYMNTLSKGKDIEIRMDGDQPVLNYFSKVIQRDVPATNGVIHVIDIPLVYF